MEDQLQINKEYIQKNINPILEKMILNILINKPANLIEYMIDWLQSNKDQFTQDQEGDNQIKYRNAYGEYSDEDGDNEEIYDLPSKEEQAKQNQQIYTKQTDNRISVSAEVYGSFNKKEEFKPKIIKKNQEQIERIRERLSQAFMFQALDNREQQIVIDAMEEQKFSKGETVIKEGEQGDILFVVDSGILNCYKQFQKNSKPTFLKQYQAGDSFGELALLYNCPRAATIIAETDSILLALDRLTFNHIVKDSAAKKREQYEEFLSKVELLDSLDAYERQQIADALKVFTFNKGDYIVREGEQGEDFYFVLEGQAEAQKILEEGQESQVVLTYKTGDYFGELALIRDTPRAASVVATSDILKLVGMDRRSFRRLMGPLEEILKRNFKRYEKFI